MNDILNRIYYILENEVDQQCFRDEEMKNLEKQKFALQDEVIRRLGEDGEELLEALSDLNLKLEDIHDKALFQAAVSLGAELAQPRR